MEIIIVGAGIAGLSAGIGLRRAGHKVTILEQSSLLHETGAAITVAPNASRVLRSWDFDFKHGKFVAIAAGGIFSGQTTEVVVPNYYVKIEETYGIPLYSAHRVDLHNGLKVLATQEDGPGTPVELQVRAKVIAYDAANGKVKLADGSVLQADLVVAADGVHSEAAGQVLGDSGVRATNTGWATMRWLVPTEELLADPETASLVKHSEQRFFVGSHGKGGLVWYPCRNNEVQNFLYLSQAFDSENATEDFKASISKDILVEHAQKDFGPAIQAVIGKAKEVMFWKLVARDPMPSWHKDRLVIIGDAAHPMLPFQAQGGNQAIEDGAALGVLFDQLQDKGSIEARLRLFEEVRRNRGSSLQILSNASHPAPQSVRDAASKYLSNGRKLENPEDVNRYVFSFDVVEECKAILVA